MPHGNHTHQTEDRSSTPNPARDQQIQKGTRLSTPLILQRAYADPSSLTATDVKHLQRTIGNRAVIGLLSKSTGLQAKLKLGPAGDQYEQEADHVAQQVVRQMDRAEPVQRTGNQGEDELAQAMPLSTTISSIQRTMAPRPKQGFVLQRLQEDEEELAQMKPLHGLEGGEVEQSVERQIQAARGGGKPLDDNVRGSMEGGFGADFGNVRVHTGGQADALNRSLNARAFTVGSDIFFKSGEYNPGSSGGKQLLAHELTHTVQQGSAGVQRSFSRLKREPGSIQRALDLVYGYSEFGGKWPSQEATTLQQVFGLFLSKLGDLSKIIMPELNSTIQAKYQDIADWKDRKESTRVNNDSQVRLALTSETQEKISEISKLINDIRIDLRRLKIDSKLKEHALRVADQSSKYDSAPALSNIMYIAPHNFKIAGHDNQTITSDTYNQDMATKTGKSSSNHYMSGLTLNKDQFDKRMQVEKAEESVPGHRAHSGGYFESLYTENQRSTFDPVNDYGKGDITGKGTGSVFHGGKHNPYQSDFNLKHRLTDAVPADSPTGAYTNTSSKFKSDEIWLEALDEAKKAASQELKTNPAPYKHTSGQFYKNFSVTLELGKEVGVGFEADKNNANKTEITDLFGNNSAKESAYTNVYNWIFNAVQTATGSAVTAKECAQAGASASFRGWQQGQDRPTRKTRIETAVNGAARGTTYTISAPKANDLAKTAESSSVNVYADSDISSVSAGITATQTGLTLMSIDPGGDNAVWADGAGQHYPAKTPLIPFTMKRFGNDLL